jgi:DNA-binding XRE family transcriptional regulator
VPRRRKLKPKHASILVPFDEYPEFFEGFTLFTRLIRSARFRLGRTQQEMAVQCGLTAEQWLLLERAQYRPPDEVVIRLAQELGLDEHELLVAAVLQDFGGE